MSRIIRQKTKRPSLLQFFSLSLTGYNSPLIQQYLDQFFIQLLLARLAILMVAVDIEKRCIAQVSAVHGKIT
jgi:hypothetical protein